MRRALALPPLLLITAAAGALVPDLAATPTSADTGDPAGPAATAAPAPTPVPPVPPVTTSSAEAQGEVTVEPTAGTTLKPPSRTASASVPIGGHGSAGKHGPAHRPAPHGPAAKPRQDQKDASSAPARSRADATQPHAKAKAAPPPPPPGPVVGGGGGVMAVAGWESGTEVVSLVPPSWPPHPGGATVCIHTGVDLEVSVGVVIFGRPCHWPPAPPPPSTPPAPPPPAPPAPPPTSQPPATPPPVTTPPAAPPVSSPPAPPPVQPPPARPARPPLALPRAPQPRPAVPPAPPAPAPAVPSRPAVPPQPTPKAPVRTHPQGTHHLVAVARPKPPTGLAAPLVTVVLVVMISAVVAILF